MNEIELLKENITWALRNLDRYISSLSNEEIEKFLAGEKFYTQIPVEQWKLECGTYPEYRGPKCLRLMIQGTIR